MVAICKYVASERNAMNPRDSGWPGAPGVRLWDACVRTRTGNFSPRLHPPEIEGAGWFIDCCERASGAAARRWPVRVLSLWGTPASAFRASSAPLTNELPEAPGVEDLDARDLTRFQEVLVPGYEHVGTDRQRLAQDHRVVGISNRHRRRLGGRIRERRRNAEEHGDFTHSWLAHSNLLDQSPRQLLDDGAGQDKDVLGQDGS